MEDFEKALIHDAIEQIKKCHERGNMDTMLMLIRLCKYIAGDKFQVSLEPSEKLPPCPICGKKAYLSHDVFDGADYGYSVGCTAFCINDGVHGFDDFNDIYNPKLPSFHGCDTKEEAFEKWVNYCKRFKGNKE